MDARFLTNNWGGEFWSNYLEKLKTMIFNFDISYILEFFAFAVTFYIVFKILRDNKCDKVIAFITGLIVLCGFAFSLSTTLDSTTLTIVIVLIDLMALTVFNTEFKRSLLGTGTKKHIKKETDTATVREVELVMDEIIRAVQHMSKNDIGALIVLSNKNLPEGIISSGTVINADINSSMIEAVFYPKAPLHDGAMIIEGQKIHAAGCFLPIIENDALPQEIGSRHRAALGVTNVAAVTAIVVSEETGIISIMKNGEIIKRYASDADLKHVLSEYYWSDVSGREV
ncbi:MAG: diadenylate cyclase [Candidatus Coproplasma sp.]